MDDIEKLKAENSDLRTKVDELMSNKYCLEGELRKATETNERLLRILENLSNGYVKKDAIAKKEELSKQLSEIQATCIAPRILLKPVTWL